MQDLSIDQDEFMRIGGTELAPMSTSHSKSVAFKYAASHAPLVFKYKTLNGMQRGASIEFLSLCAPSSPPSPPPSPSSTITLHQPPPHCVG